MSYNYTPLQSSAGRMIEKFGQSYTFTRVTDGAYNPATGKTSTSSATYTKNACVFDYSEADLAEGTILRGDRRLLVESGEYQVGDTVAIGSDVYRVVSVAEIKPAGTVVAANLQVRK